MVIFKDFGIFWTFVMHFSHFGSFKGGHFKDFDVFIFFFDILVFLTGKLIFL